MEWGRGRRSRAVERERVARNVLNAVDIDHNGRIDNVDVLFNAWSGNTTAARMSWNILAVTGGHAVNLSTLTNMVRFAAGTNLLDTAQQWRVLGFMVNGFPDH